MPVSQYMLENRLKVNLSLYSNAHKTLEFSLKKKLTSFDNLKHLIIIQITLRQNLEG
jgi:hypothetical protein